MTQVESLINVSTTYNWSDAYATLNVDVRGILKEVATNLAAMYVIQYDMSGFSSRIEAETMLDVLREGALRGMSILRNKNPQEFMINA